MEKSILPPLHVDTEAATTVRAPSAVFTLIVVWVEAFVALPHFVLGVRWLVWLCRLCCWGWMMRVVVVNAVNRVM